MQNRRQFLSKTGKAALVASALPAILPKDITLPKGVRIPNGEPHALSYRGFTLAWTGWKTLADSAKIAGQWIASPEHYQEDVIPRHFYASFPGTSGEFFKGQHFGLTIFPGQEICFTEEIIRFPESALARLDAAREDTLARLKRTIDEALEGKKTLEEPIYTFGFTGFKA